MLGRVCVCVNRRVLRGQDGLRTTTRPTSKSARDTQPRATSCKLLGGHSQPGLLYVALQVLHARCVVTAEVLFDAGQIGNYKAELVYGTFPEYGVGGYCIPQARAVQRSKLFVRGMQKMCYVWEPAAAFDLLKPLAALDSFQLRYLL